jgi:hypothetical protein
MKWIRNAILRWARARQPDFVIGGAERPYLRRHWLIPRNRVFNIYVHEFLRSDDDRALHDHPWLFNCSWLLEGAYIEWTPADEAHLMPDVGVRCQYPEQHERRAGDVKFRWGRAPHRIQLLRAGFATANGSAQAFGGELPCWTVFITGPRVRQWGFYCEKGWIHWKRFTAASDPGAIGKGCEA